MNTTVANSIEVELNLDRQLEYPMDVVEALSKLVGRRGVVAGGCIRDIVLGRKPKDYDVFIYKMKDYTWITSTIPNVEIEDEKTHEKKPNKYYNSKDKSGGGDKMRVCSVTLFGHPVQFIHLIRKESPPSNPEEVIGQFDFTINMMAFDGERIILADSARRAKETKHVIYNPNHKMGFRSSNVKTVEHLTSRAYYLSGKLGFILPKETLAAIFERFPCDDDTVLEEKSF